MKLRVVLFWVTILVLMAQSGCDVVETPEEKVTLQGANIRGTVVRRDTQAPISGALVYDAVGLPRDTSKADGSFILRYPDITQRYSSTVVARKDGFEGDSINFILNPGFDTTVTLRLRELLFQVPPSARQPAQIAFINSSAPYIFVSGVGSTQENAVLTYEVRDSTGTPIGNKVFATYTVQFFPNTFVGTGTPPAVIPTGDSTDNAGRLRLTVKSGTRAGVVQIVVSVTTSAGVIRSQPVRLSVNSGFPDQRHFTLSADRYNFPGLEAAALPQQQGLGARVVVRAQVGDRYSNPVLPGTVVYFSTLHGVISTKDGPTSGQFGVTDEEGFVSQYLMAGNPYPRGANALPGLGPGYSYVYAQTIGENGSPVIDSILVLWTGKPIITKLDTLTSFTVPNGGAAGPFRFKVADIFDHPMSAGTTITVTADFAVVSGDAFIVMRDTFASGPGTTEFSVILRDPNALDADPPAPSLLRVEVRHPSYDITVHLTLATGTVD